MWSTRASGDDSGWMNWMDGWVERASEQAVRTVCESVTGS